MNLPKPIYYLSAFGSIVGTYILFKDKSGEEIYPGKENLYGKTVIVTGGTSGIGKYLVEEFAKRGGRIIVGCRNIEKCIEMIGGEMEGVDKKNLICKKLNLSSIGSIKHFADEIIKNESRLDILINNAGVLSNKRSVTEDGFESQLGINYLGRFLLTNLLIDKMLEETHDTNKIIPTKSDFNSLKLQKKNENEIKKLEKLKKDEQTSDQQINKTEIHTNYIKRILNIVCVGYRDSFINFEDFNSEKHYSNKSAGKMSSLANILFTKTLSQKLDSSKIMVYAVNPGMVETDLRREFGAHKSIFSGFVLKPLWSTMFSLPQQASQTILYLALSSVATHSSFNGKVYYNYEEDSINPEIFNKKIMDKLWALSSYWTKFPEIRMSISSKDVNKIQ